MQTALSIILSVISVYGVAVAFAEAKRRARLAATEDIPGGALRDFAPQSNAAWEKPFWFIVHNFIAHPLLVFSVIGALCDRFHNYTAEKM